MAVHAFQGGCDQDAVPATRHQRAQSVQRDDQRKGMLIGYGCMLGNISLLCLLSLMCVHTLIDAPTHPFISSHHYPSTTISVAAVLSNEFRLGCTRPALGRPGRNRSVGFSFDCSLSWLVVCLIAHSETHMTRKALLFCTPNHSTNTVFLLSTFVDHLSAVQTSEPTDKVL